MNAKNLTIAALLLASLTLTAAAQSVADREPSLNPSSQGVQMRADAQKKSADVYVARVGDRLTVEAKCGEAAKLELRAFAKDNDAAKKNLAAEFLPLGGSVSWTARVPESLAGRTVIFQALARTLSGKTYTETIEIHFRAASQPKPQDDDQGSSSRPQPDFRGNARK